jgi:uncharacterized protein YxjI
MTLVFYDMQRNEIFALKNRHFTIHKSFHAEGPDGKDIFVVKGRFSRKCDMSRIPIRFGRNGFLPTTTFPPHFQGPIKHGHVFPFPPQTGILKHLLIPLVVFSSKSTVKFTNATDSQPVKLEVKGSWWCHSANITYGRQTVAHISRKKFNMREIFGGKQTRRRTRSHE